ncbi:MAG: twin-arginine translocase subunit TatC [Acidobacteriota bacterium]
MASPQDPDQAQGETSPTPPAEHDTNPSEDYYGDDSYGEPATSGAVAEVPPEEPPPTAVDGAEGTAPPAAPPPAPPAGEAEEDQEEGRMLRMSFLDHLEELRSRILKCLAGIGVAFLLSLIFANDLWLIVSEPATAALQQLGVKDPRLAQITPMEVFQTVWIKLPMLTAIFLASPWVLYQVWAFIAPGLYRRERHWAGPFVLCSAGLFILGGLFAYFVAFRYGLTFLLGIGRDIRIQPIVSVTEYFDLFVNVTLGVGLVFELPILVFFLTLLRIVTPRFLIRNSRYAILVIVLLAALATPTPDVFNLMLFSVPMVLLYFVGVFASYLLVLHREERRFPWRQVLYVVFVILAAIAGLVYLAITRYGYRPAPHWPFLTR